MQERESQMRSAILWSVTRSEFFAVGLNTNAVQGTVQNMKEWAWTRNVETEAVRDWQQGAPRFFASLWR